MMRPKSIVQFERVYIATIVLGLLNTVLSWNATADQLAAVDPMMRQLGPGVIATGTAISLLVNLVLLYFIARRGSRIAKWIMVVLTVAGILAALPAFMVAPMPPLIVVITFAMIALSLFAVYLLFRPDAQAWFGGSHA